MLTLRYNCRPGAPLFRPREPPYLSPGQRPRALPTETTACKAETPHLAEEIPPDQQKSPKAATQSSPRLTRRSLSIHAIFPLKRLSFPQTSGNVPMASIEFPTSRVSTLRLKYSSLPQIPGSIGVQVLGRSLELCSTSDLFSGPLQKFAENVQFPMCKLGVPNTIFPE